MKRIVLIFAATAVLAIPATAAFADHPTPKKGGVLPEQLCFAALPWKAQPLLCGYDKGGPEGEGTPVHG